MTTTLETNITAQLEQLNTQMSGISDQLEQMESSMITMADHIETLGDTTKRICETIKDTSKQ